jgi:hypothetical protein
MWVSFLFLYAFVGLSCDFEWTRIEKYYGFMNQWHGRGLFNIWCACGIMFLYRVYGNTTDGNGGHGWKYWFALIVSFVYLIVGLVHIVCGLFNHKHHSHHIYREEVSVSITSRTH